MSILFHLENLPYDGHAGRFGGQGSAYLFVKKKKRSKEMFSGDEIGLCANYDLMF
jgi:hypothetical protein